MDDRVIALALANIAAKQGVGIDFYMPHVALEGDLRVATHHKHLARNVRPVAQTRIRYSGRPPRGRGRGADVILDHIGPSYLPRDLEALAVARVDLSDANERELVHDLNLRAFLFGCVVRRHQP